MQGAEVVVAQSVGDELALFSGGGHGADVAVHGDEPPVRGGPMRLVSGRIFTDSIAPNALDASLVW